MSDTLVYPDKMLAMTALSNMSPIEATAMRHESGQRIRMRHAQSQRSWPPFGHDAAFEAIVARWAKTLAEYDDSASIQAARIAQFLSNCPDQERACEVCAIVDEALSALVHAKHGLQLRGVVGMLAFFQPSKNSFRAYCKMVRNLPNSGEPQPHAAAANAPWDEAAPRGTDEEQQPNFAANASPPPEFLDMLTALGVE